MSNIIDSIQLSGTVYTISGGSGGNYSAGRGISIDSANTISLNVPISAGTGTNSIREGNSGNTASGNYSHAEGRQTSATSSYSHAEGYSTSADGYNSHAEGSMTRASGGYGAHAEGANTIASGSTSHAEGGFTVAGGIFSHAEGENTIANNESEHASGKYNISLSEVPGATGHSGNTLFSVGNGTADNARHNAFEIRQNGDIYLTLDGQDVKLQDHLGGGGGGNATVELTQAEYDALVSAGTVSANTYYIITDAQAGDLTQYWTSAQTQSAITSATSGKVDTSTYNTYTAATDTALNGKQATLVSGTNIKTINNESILGSGNIDIQGGGVNVVQTTGTSTTDVMSQNAVTTQLSGYVTTDTEQEITGEKTFVGEKKLKFKQSGNSSKIGFTLYNSAPTNNELASFEFRPNTFTIDNVQHPLLYFGHYRNTNTANAGVPQTVIGFRQYDQKNAAAYHYLIPLPEKAKTPFSLTTSFKDYYAPIGFKNGSTMITTDNTGVADFSDVLGGLKLVKLTQSEYDALTTKDDNTVYFIGDSTNGYTIKIGNASVN